MVHPTTHYHYEATAVRVGGVGKTLGDQRGVKGNFRLLKLVDSRLKPIDKERLALLCLRNALMRK